MKKILLAGAALLAVSVGPVLADDVPGGALAPGMQLAQMPPPPMASPAMAWSVLCRSERRWGICNYVSLTNI